MLHGLCHSRSIAASAAQVGELLAASEVWRTYAGARHDMFLPRGTGAEVRFMRRECISDHGLVSVVQNH